MARTPSHNRLPLRQELALPPAPPAFAALAVQAVAALTAAAIGVAAAAMAQGNALGFLQWALLQGIIAAAIGHRLGMAVWWLPIHLAFAPALVTTLSFNWSPPWFLGAFLLLALVYGKTYRTQVPLYLSSRAAAEATARLLPRDGGFSFLDLGSGGGGLIRHLHQARPDGNYHGIEAALLPFLLSLCRNLNAAHGCRISWGDFWIRDLAPYDVVYAYLSPAPMAALWRKARMEMRPGSVFISNSFAVPGVEPELCIELRDLGRSRLYLWRM